MYPNPSENKENISADSRLNQFISDQYYGDLHTKNVPVTGDRFPHIYDGYGNQSSLQLGTGSVKINGDDFNIKLLINTFYPIGSIFTTTANSVDLPFTTWEKISRGRFIASVGTGVDSDGNSRTINEGSSGGLYMVSLTEDQIPNHTHDVNSTYKYFTLWNHGGLGRRFAGDAGNDTFAFPERTWHHATGLESIGSSHGHNNIPPAFGVNIFKRIS